MLRFVSIRVGKGLPLGCIRCGGDVAREYDSTAVVVARIQDALACSGGLGLNVLLTGPEPFAHPELPALVAACAEAGAQRIALETDGGALSAHRNAAGLLHAGVTHIRLRTLAAGTLGDELCGHSGLNASLEAGLQTYMKAAERAGIPVCVMAIIPVCHHNLSALPGTVASLASWGVHAVRLCVGNIARSLPSSAESLIAAACETGMVNRLWVETDGALPLPEGYELHSVPEEALDV